MFIVEPQLNMVDLLKEELRVLKKNEETIYDMFALYHFLENDGDLKSLVGTTLLEKVISDFEDPEVTVSYKAKNIKDIYNITETFYAINKKYSKYIGCRKILDEYRASYKEHICFGDIQKLISDEKDKEFNLLLTIAEKDSHLWALEFISSNIPEKVRMEMLVDLLKKDFCDVLKFKKYIFPRAKSDYKKEKIQELFDSLNENEMKREYLNYLIENERFEQIAKIQESFLDFTIYRWDTNYKPKTVISMIVNINSNKNDNRLNSFMKLYQSASYKNIPDYIHNNDDNFILNNIYYYDLIRFISLSNFKLTKEKLNLIVERFKKHHKDYNEYDERDRQHFEESRQLIINTIIHKAKNKEEYKEMLEYVKYFTENTNLEKERLETIQKQQLLQNARTNFSTMLYNLNEHLQETEPSRKLIKNIDFKKNN